MAKSRTDNEGRDKDKKKKKKRGFAAMDKNKQRRIASMGGSASGGNFRNNPERARQAGRIGGSR